MQSWIFSIITPVFSHKIFQKSTNMLIKIIIIIIYKKVVLFNIFVETWQIFFRIIWWIKKFKWSKFI